MVRPRGRVVGGTVLSVCVFVAFCGGGATSPSTSASSGSTSTSNSSWPTCDYSVATGASRCGCSVVSPFPATAPGGEIWPFGVHAQSGHTEGHRGLDLSSSEALPIVSPMDGVVFSIDNAQDSSGGLAAEYVAAPNLHFTTINMDCGLQVRFIPLLLDAGIVAGTRVAKGQRLGTTAAVVPRFGQSRWSSHFEIDSRAPASDPALNAVCPADLFSAGEVNSLQTILGASSYPEKVARTVGITCENGSVAQVTFPAEDKLCNPRLDPATRAVVAACLPGRASSIW